MTISKEILDELLQGVERPEGLLGDAGLMKELKIKDSVPGNGVAFALRPQLGRSYRANCELKTRILIVRKDCVGLVPVIRAFQSAISPPNGGLSNLGRDAFALEPRSDSLSKQFPPMSRTAVTSHSSAEAGRPLRPASFVSKRHAAKAQFRFHPK